MYKPPSCWRSIQFWNHASVPDTAVTSVTWKRKKQRDIPNLSNIRTNVFLLTEPLSEAEATQQGRSDLRMYWTMYENYPFWATFFKKLGFRVVLSPQSTRKIYELGIDSIPSESECSGETGARVIFPGWSTRCRFYFLSGDSLQAQRVSGCKQPLQLPDSNLYRKH